MVKFDGIGLVNDKGWVMAFENIKILDEFREAMWKKTHPLQEIGFISQVALRKGFERRMEEQYQLPNQSLKGLCLIFGSPEEAIGRLRIPEVRALLANPDTEASLRIAIHEGQVTSRVKAPNTTYTFSYPIAQVSLPTDLDLTKEYLAFADDRAIDLDAQENVMVVFEGTRRDMMKEIVAANPWLANLGPHFRRLLEESEQN